MPKFLIVKASSLGDIIQAFPCASYLKNKFPEATIDWVVESSFAELVQAHPDVNSVIPIDTKIWRKHLLSKDTWKSMIDIKKQIQKETYDVVFDLQGNMKSGIMTYLSKAKIKVGLGWKSVSEKPNVLCTHQRFNFKESINIRDDYLSIVQQYYQDSTPFESASYNLKLSLEQQHLYQDTLKAIEDKAEALPKIMICPGSAWPNKQLTQEAMLDFLERLHQHTPSHFILIWGSSNEFEFVQSLHKHFPLSSLLPRLSLPVLQNLMNDMNLIIAVDSLPLHLAGTTKSPTFSVFGASLAEKFKPQGPHHIALQGRCPYGRTFKKRCPILRTCPTGACIRSLTGNSLFEFFLTQT